MQCRADMCSIVSSQNREYGVKQCSPKQSRLLQSSIVLCRVYCGVESCTELRICKVVHYRERWLSTRILITRSSDNKNRSIQLSTLEYRINGGVGYN